MRRLRIAIAYSAAAAGLLLPWRLRLLYNEALGWLAQLLPPSLYDPDEGERDHD